jgi:hypothetical protein
MGRPFRHPMRQPAFSAQDRSRPLVCGAHWRAVHEQVTPNLSSRSKAGRRKPGRTPAACRSVRRRDRRSRSHRHHPGSRPVSACRPGAPGRHRFRPDTPVGGFDRSPVRLRMRPNRRSLRTARSRPLAPPRPRARTLPPQGRPAARLTLDELVSSRIDPPSSSLATPSCASGDLARRPSAAVKCRSVRYTSADVGRRTTGRPRSSR